MRASDSITPRAALPQLGNNICFAVHTCTCSLQLHVSLLWFYTTVTGNTCKELPSSFAVHACATMCAAMLLLLHSSMMTSYNWTSLLLLCIHVPLHFCYCFKQAWCQAYLQGLAWIENTSISLHSSPLMSLASLFLFQTNCLSGYTCKDLPSWTSPPLLFVTVSSNCSVRPYL